MDKVGEKGVVVGGIIKKKKSNGILPNRHLRWRPDEKFLQMENFSPLCIADAPSPTALVWAPL